MGGAEQDAAWDDWEEQQPPPEATNASASAAVDGEDWGWDVAALEANAALVESANPSLSATALAGEDDGSDDGARLLGLAVAAPAVYDALQRGRRKAVALLALAKVAKLHLLAARDGFAALVASESVAPRENGDDHEQLEREIAALGAEVRGLAGDWTESISAWTRDDSKRLEEMAGALRHSLTASGGDDQDLSLFQQVVEQIFDALPGRTLRVSVEWIHPASNEDADSDKSAKKKGKSHQKTDESEVGGYLSQLLVMMTEGESQVAKGASAAKTNRRPTRVPVLSDAEIFQDAKDIARDELAINGELVAGSIGYDAIVDRIQTQLEQLLAAEIGKPLPQFSMQLSDTLHRIAMEVLNASNRTESGGSAYEVLGRFVTNHEMDHVLIRPASAKAPPIQIDMDMGAYQLTEGVDAQDAATNWGFGVRVTLTAVTWYLVCDAADPTVELYEVKTTYRNRLAFPVGLTPFHPINHMRKDHGAVDLQLTLPSPSPSASQADPSKEQGADYRGEGDEGQVTTATFEAHEESAAVAFDELL